MTQTDIFQNMTKGEWKKGRTTIYGGNHLFIHRDDKGMIPDTDENYEAMVSAVNNTYGKGINPESVVELYECLKVMLEWSDYIKDRYGKDVLPVSIRTCTEVLNAARL